MMIEICGQETAVSLVANARERFSVISITATEDGDVAFPANENAVAILRLRFNDLTEAYDEDGFPYGRPLPEQGDFEGLKTFVDALDGERLIVHCWLIYFPDYVSLSFLEGIIRIHYGTIIPNYGYQIYRSLFL